MREAAGMTLTQLAELSGYSVAAVNGVELNNEGSSRLKNKLLDILLSRQEDGESAEIKFWRNRALSAETKLESLKSAITAALKKI